MDQWAALAGKIVQGLNVQAGEIIQVRGEPGSYEFLTEMLLAIELAGATPLPEIFTANTLDRMWAHAPLDYLANWDRHRKGWMEQIHRVVTFPRPEMGPSLAPRDRIDAWRLAAGRIVEIEEKRRLPFLVVALPTPGWANALGLAYETLVARLLPALLISAEDLRREIEHTLEAIGDRRELVLHSGNGCELHLVQGGRMWLKDDGIIDEDDRQRGAVVSNFPAGSIYTTVLENETHGSLWLPQAREARNLTLHFEQGRIVEIEASSGAEAFRSWLFAHSGEPGRVSHIGIGLNPALRQPMGWEIPVDEHVYGSLFLALGENRYMGGQNVSSLNHDFVIQQASLLAGGKEIVREGKLINST